ncbi:MAG: ABC transporter ATP-binding protein [Phycisphaerae bacterium]|nr:ABC transporter ATP-binding protein [Phycisphaerae bacterium]
MLELLGVGKQYDERWVLRGVDLRADAGRVIALIGPSGSGKSTLLRVMLGLIEPSEGRVLVDGEEVVGASAWRVARRRVGYVIQDGGLFPHMTARRNAMLALDHAGRSDRREALVRLTELTGLVRLDAALLDRFPSELSGGQRQRVALLRALVSNPETLLLDEPLGALDPEVRAEAQRELRDLFRSLGKAVVFVTHDLAEAAYLADEIVLLRDGVVVQRGSFAELRSSPVDDFVSRFVGAQVDRVRALLDGAVA